jgi:hypothetical protein
MTDRGVQARIQDLRENWYGCPAEADELGDWPQMALWKRLTDASGISVDVNMEVAAFMHRYRDHTQITFNAGQGESALSVSVQETPDQIHSRPALSSK